MLARALSGYLDPLLLSGNNGGVSSVLEIQPSTSFETPGFARSIYPLLEDLYEIFGDLPSIGKALAHVQKMLLDVNRGEGLRPINRKGGAKSDKVEFSELPADDKLHALFAHAIRSQTEKFTTIVAVVDASALAVVAPGVATSGAKTSGIMKVARKLRPVGFLPWATFAGSIGTCSGLLLYGDGIECAVESLPAAPSIASLGRGIQHLREASEAVMRTEGSRIQTSIESLIKRIKNAKD
uniref:Uncharacterized protein n=1 Tax=Cajanus cajan TaxID=3821 RepID=A0A151TLZ6_CAJCA|nr:hypothetical protein KK1_021667 [Cajanus cajan]